MQSVYWDDEVLKMIDQTQLPHHFEVITCHTYEEVANAIVTMKVRGAPAIGVAAAFGLVLGSKQIKTTGNAFHNDLMVIADELKKTRPTAVNLFWAIERIMDIARVNSHKDSSEIKNALLQEALIMAEEDVETNRNIGHYGQALIKNGDCILTHCNAGALATVDYGTALGVIRSAFAAGKNIHVYVDETRPLLQGARLTAWEMVQEGIPATLITDNMAGYFMQQGKVDLIIVGADRITANGDVANKIGTYSLSVLAKENGIPFYIAAPFSTVDFTLKSGHEIIIEERNPEEVTCVQGKQVAPEGIKVSNPAFDVTPCHLISGIITEKGVIYPPYEKNLMEMNKK